MTRVGVGHRPGPCAKVFKLRALTRAPGEAATVSRRVSFRQHTTRAHHPGRHRVEALVNGAATALGHVDLRAQRTGGEGGGATICCIDRRAARRVERPRSLTSAAAETRGAAHPHCFSTGRRSAKWHSAEVGEHHADLTPNPLSLKGEGARSMRKQLEFNLSLPLSL